MGNKTNRDLSGIRIGSVTVSIFTSEVTPMVVVHPVLLYHSR